MKKVNQENDKQSSFWSKCNFELVEKEQIMAAMMMILSSVKEKKSLGNSGFSKWSGKLMT